MKIGVANFDQSGTCCDVVIIGAGLAGLVAADHLLRHDSSLKVLVLEAKDRVGGRTNTITLRTRNGGSDQFDIGGQWVGSTQTHILELLRRFEIPIYEQYTLGRKLCQVGSTKIRHYDGALPGLSDFGRFGLMEAVDFALFFRGLDRLTWRVSECDLNLFSPESVCGCGLSEILVWLEEGIGETMHVGL